MQIYPTTDVEEICTFLRNEHLFKLTDGQDSKLDINDILPGKEWKYLIIREGKELICLIDYKELTKVVAEVHIRILPKYQHKLSKQCAILGILWFTKYTKYLRVFTRTPKLCRHVIRFLKKLNFNQCGEIENGIVFNNELTNLLMFDYELKR